MNRWLLVALVACDAGGAAHPPSRSLALAPVSAAAEDEAPLTADDVFRWAVVRRANRTQRAVQSWGTIRLDGAHPRRFAVLDALDAVHGRGAYVFELAPAQFVTLTFQQQTWSVPVVRGADEDVPWTISADRSIVHETHHATGYERITFGQRGDRVVVFDDEDVQDLYKPELNVHEVYLNHGRCAPECPVLDFEFYGDDAEFSQSDIAPSVDALVDPYRYHFE